MLAQFCVAKPVACRWAIKRTRKKRRSFLLHTFLPLRWAGVQTTKPVSNHKREPPKGWLSFGAADFCGAKISAANGGPLIKRARETRQRFPLHTFLSLRYAGGACGQQNLWAVTEKPFPFGNGFFACEEGIRNESRLRWHYRSRYEQLITFSDRNMKSSAFCSEKRTAQLPGICLEAALFAGLKSVTRRLPCAFSLIVDGAGQSKGTCQ